MCRTAVPSQESVDLFLRLRPHLAIAHHVPGRIRLRVGFGALGVIGEAGAAAPTLDHLAPLFAPGAIRVNPQARSVVITHDPARFPIAFWRDCLDGPEEAARAAIVAAMAGSPRAAAGGFGDPAVPDQTSHGQTSHGPESDPCLEISS